MKLVIQDKQEGKYAEVDATFFAIRELSRSKRSTLNSLIKKKPQSWKQYLHLAETHQMKLITITYAFWTLKMAESAHIAR